MGMYSENFDEDYGLDMDALVEAFLIDDLTHNYSEDAVKEFCAPNGIGDALLEAKVLSTKRSVMRLSKASDLKRRETIAAIMMAKAKGDTLYGKLVKYKLLFKQTRAKIVQKYGSKAAKAAIKGQKEYIKTMKNVNLSNSGSGQWLTPPDKDPRR